MPGGGAYQSHSMFNAAYYSSSSDNGADKLSEATIIRHLDASDSPSTKKELPDFLKQRLKARGILKTDTNAVVSSLSHFMCIYATNIHV